MQILQIKFTATLLLVSIGAFLYWSDIIVKFNEFYDQSTRLIRVSSFNVDTLIESKNPSFNRLLANMFRRKKIKFPSVNNTLAKDAGDKKVIYKLQTHVGNKTKVLSYCVFGKKALKKYSNSIKAVLKQSAKSRLYRSWEVRIYTDIIFTVSFLTKMSKINDKVTFINVTKLTYYPRLQHINAMMWRFIPMADSKVDVVCFRDLDSDLYKREEAAVREFLQSNNILHVMRDNKWHDSKIMGGLWCFRNIKNRELGKGLLKTILKNAQNRIPGKSEAQKGNDQNVLNEHVWPIVLHDAMVHDSFHCKWKPGGRPFPTRRLPSEPFVGCASRPCEYDFELLRCPVECRPNQHKDWEHC